MSTNHSSNVGKFAALKTLNAFDSALIEMFGRNMTDAHITRYEALAAIEATQGVHAAALLLGQQRGWSPVAQVS
jgi:hypothetical protein